MSVITQERVGMGCLHKNHAWQSAHDRSDNLQILWLQHALEIWYYDLESEGIGLLTAQCFKGWWDEKVLWCIREVGSSRSMIWKRVGRVVDLVESPYSSSTKAPGFLMPRSSISILCRRQRKVWRNPGTRRRMPVDQSTSLELIAMTLFPTPVSYLWGVDYMQNNAKDKLSINVKLNSNVCNVWLKVKNGEKTEDKA